MNTWSQDGYIAAYIFAARAHAGQTVPGSGLPYVVHLSLVSMEVLGALARERVDQPDLAVTCALLHDTIEDTGVTRDVIAREFGEAVAAGVDALTKRDSAGATKAERMADSLARLRLQPREVQLVKLADRITNLQPPPADWSREKRVAYREEAGRILAALGSASESLAERLRAKIDAYGAYL